jgi:hypothetical protein
MPSTTYSVSVSISVVNPRTEVFATLGAVASPRRGGRWHDLCCWWTNISQRTPITNHASDRSFGAESIRAVSPAELSRGVSVALLQQLLASLRRNVDEQGVRGLGVTVRSGVRFVANEIRYRAVHQDDAVNVYDRDWDVLVLLDCATIDMMTDVADEYPFVDNVGEHTSTGTCSDEWMRHTFTASHREEMARTLHVTANTSSDRHLRDDRFLHLEEVWRDGWDETLGTIPARAVTDRAIRLHRELDPDRTIVHYMQPHLPFVTHDIESNTVTPVGVRGEGLTLGELHDEGYGRDTLWGASLDNLRYVLDDVELLLHSIDARDVVLSSDHGQAFGEDGVWAHPCYTYVDVLKRVPWCLTSASDDGAYQPTYDPQGDADPELTVEEKLEALGYR